MHARAQIKEDTYVYLGYHNYVNRIVLIDRFSKGYKLRQIQSIIDEKNKIYTNGGSVIYLSSSTIVNETYHINLGGQ